MKDSFLMYLSFEELLMRLTPDELRRMMMAIFRYHGGAVEPDFSDNRVLEMCWQPLKTQFERDAQKYAKICQRNAENGKHGGRPQENPKEPKKPTGFCKNPKEPKKPDTDTDTDKEKVSTVVDTKETTPAFNYPSSVEEILEIAARPEVGVRMTRGEAERYFVFRSSTDWIDAANREIKPARIGFDLKRWVLNSADRRKTQDDRKIRATEPGRENEGRDQIGF